MSHERCARVVRSATLVTCAALLTSIHAAPAHGLPRAAPVELAGEGLAISAPSAPVSLGSRSAGSTFSAQLGSVTVTAPAGTTSWTARVTLTSSFRVTQGDQTWVLPNDRVSYLSGPATAGTISLSLCTQGQVTAQTLVQTRDAFRCQGLLGLTASTVTWRPTLTIQSQPTDPAGTYTGTITHSVL